MDGVTILSVSRRLYLLSVDNIFGQMHLSFKGGRTSIKDDVDLSSRQKRWPALEVAILNDFSLFHWNFLIGPLLVFVRSEIDITFFDESECDWFIGVNYFFPSEPIKLGLFCNILITFQLEHRLEGLSEEFDGK